MSLTIQGVDIEILYHMRLFFVYISIKQGFEFVKVIFLFSLPQRYIINTFSLPYSLTSTAFVIFYLNAVRMDIL